MKNLTLLLLSIILISCGSSKKTTTNSAITTENSSLNEKEKKVLENKVEKDTSSVKSSNLKTDNSSTTTVKDKKTKIVLKTEKDSLGNTKPAHYKEVVNGKTKTEISINGKGEVLVETSETTTEKSENTSKTLKDSLVNSGTTTTKHKSIKEKDIALNQEKKASTLNKQIKKNTFFLFQWWFWLLVILAIVFFLYLQKRFQWFFKLKSIFNKKTQ